jgi:hypothetical protein
MTVSRRPRPAPPRARRSTLGGRSPEPSGSSLPTMTGVLAVLAAAAFIVCHGLALATAPTAAARTLRATLPALTDLDQAITVHVGAIAAAGTDADGPVPVPGVPIEITVPPQAARAGGAALRRAALDAMVARVYAQGDEAFRAPTTQADGAASFLSSQWTVRRALGGLTRGVHDDVARGQTVFGLGAVALAALLALQVEPGRRTAAVAGVAAIAAVVAGVGALLARGLVWLLTSGDDDVVSDVVARTARDLTMTVVLVALIVAVAAGVFVALSVLSGRLIAEFTAGRRARPAPARRGPPPRPWEET